MQMWTENMDTNKHIDMDTMMMIFIYCIWIVCKITSIAVYR
jgi:hypothetical protein